MGLEAKLRKRIQWEYVHQDWKARDLWWQEGISFGFSMPNIQKLQEKNKLKREGIWLRMSRFMVVFGRWIQLKTQTHTNTQNFFFFLAVTHVSSLLGFPICLRWLWFSCGKPPAGDSRDFQRQNSWSMTELTAATPAYICSPSCGDTSVEGCLYQSFSTSFPLFLPFCSSDLRLYKMSSVI